VVEGQVLAFNNNTNPAERANSITNILVQGRDPQPLLDYCRDKCGVVLGVGLGELTGKAFSHCPYGPRQCADGARHARRRGDGLGRHCAFRTALAASRLPWDYLGREVPA